MLITSSSPASAPWPSSRPSGKTVDVPGALKQAENYSRQLLQSQFEDDGQRWGEFKIPFTFATNGRAFLRQVKDKSGIWFRDLRRPYNHGRPLIASIGASSG